MRAPSRVDNIRMINQAGAVIALYKGASNTLYIEATRLSHQGERDYCWLLGLGPRDRRMQYFAYGAPATMQSDPSWHLLGSISCVAVWVRVLTSRATQVGQGVGIPARCTVYEVPAHLHPRAREHDPYAPQ